MKQKLVKFELHIDFSCKPKINAYHYEDEIMNDNKVYQNQIGERNNKTLVHIGQIWLNYEDELNQPFWKANVIVREDIQNEKLIELIDNLYNVLKMIVKNSLETFKYRFANIEKVNETEIMKIFRYGSLEEAKFFININELKNIIIDKAKFLGKRICLNDNEDYEKWKIFFDEQIKSDILDNLLKRFVVLKIINDDVEFQSSHNSDKIIFAISDKLAKDIFVLYKK